MLRYTLNRLLLLLPLLFGLSVLTFLYMHVIPGDPIAGMLGPGGNAQLIGELLHVPVDLMVLLPGIRRDLSNRKTLRRHGRRSVVPNS